MQNLAKLSQLVSAAQAVSEIALKAQSHRFAVSGPVTLYAHLADAEVIVERRPLPYLEVAVQLHAPFAWRVAFDQDDAGVYVVARRRPIVGEIGGGSFRLIVRPDTFLHLRLDDCRLVLEHMDDTLELPPAGGLRLAASAEPRS